MSWVTHLWRWIEVHTGTVNESGPYYGFWSGFGANFGEFALIGGAIAIFRSHNCHVKGCWRLKRHPVEGTPYCVCAKHHPAVPQVVSVDHVVDAHQAAL